MVENPTPTRRFTPANQRAFADLSGDHNLLHIDSLQARRSFLGGPAVHGIHTLLWAFDIWMGSNHSVEVLTSIRARFLRPIPVDAEVSVSLADDSAGGVSMHLIVGTVTFAIFEAVFGASSGEIGAGDIIDEVVPYAAPRDVAREQIIGMTGVVPLSLSRTLARELFPHVARRLPTSQLAALLATTRVVGVECPGLHSLYSELHLASVDDAPTGHLQYRVTGFDTRFGLATIATEGGGLRGIVKAFRRPAPQRQLTYEVIRQSVQAGEFEGHHALVVGGSRGLGEVVAKAMAAGGAEVTITYHRGEDDARRVVGEITSGGGMARFVPLDVTSQHSDGDSGEPHCNPTHLYYMATPFIFAGQRGVFQPSVFARFCGYYVDGFAATFTRFLSPSLRGVFYPSSVAIDELPPDMLEYVAAKSAGEMLCRALEKANPRVRILQSRLPRMGTDQTMSLMPVRNLQPLPVMLNLLRMLGKEAR